MLIIWIEQRVLVALAPQQTQLLPIICAQPAPNAQVGVVVQKVVRGAGLNAIEQRTQRTQCGAFTRLIGTIDHMQSLAARAEVEAAPGEGPIGKQLQFQELHASTPSSEGGS